MLTFVNGSDWAFSALVSPREPPSPVGPEAGAPRHWKRFQLATKAHEPHLIPYQIVNSFSVLASPAINVIFGGTFFFSRPCEFQIVMMVLSRAKANVSLCFSALLHHQPQPQLSPQTIP